MTVPSSGVFGGRFWDIAANSDDELRAVIIMLYSMHARAPVSLVGAGNPRGGWWGNSYPDRPGVELGSLFWAMRGKPINAKLIEDHRIEGIRCLRPLVEYGVASKVDTSAERVGTNVIGVSTFVQRPSDTEPRFVVLWENVL